MHKLILGGYRDGYFNLREILDKMSINTSQELPISFLERFKDNELIYVGDRYNFIDGNVEYVYPNERLCLKTEGVTFYLESDIENYMKDQPHYKCVTERSSNTKFLIGDSSFDLNIFKDKVRVDNFDDFRQRMKNVLCKKLNPDTADFMIGQLDLVEGVNIRYSDIRSKEFVIYYLLQDDGRVTRIRSLNAFDSLSPSLSKSNLNSYIGYSLSTSNDTIIEHGRILDSIVHYIDPLDYGISSKFSFMIDLGYEDLVIQWEFIKQSYPEKLYYEYDGKLFTNKRWCRDILRKFHLWINK